MTGRGLPSFWRVVLVAVGVVAVANVLVGIGAGRLEEPETWYASSAQRRIDEATILQLQGIGTDVLFVGTSMIQHDVMVQTVEKRAPGIDQARNAGIPAAQTPVVRRWVLEEMVPRVHPALVVWGISSIDFNGNRPSPTIERYDSARSTKPGWIGAFDRLLGRVSVLSRYRESFRDPATIGRLLGAGPATSQDDPAAAVDVDRLMAPTNQWSDEIHRTAEEAERIRSEPLADWEIGSEEAEAFRSTITELRAQGVAVVVMVMPVPSQYMGLHPDGAIDYAEFLEFVESETADLGVPLLDFTDAMPDDAFHDFTHLNGNPARLFSRLVAAGLTELGW